MDHNKIQAMMSEDANFLQIVNELLKDPSFDDLNQTDIQDVLIFFARAAQLSGMLRCRGDVMRTEKLTSKLN